MTQEEKDLKKRKQTDPNRKKKKKKGSASTILFLLILLVGFCVLLYPTVSDFWNQMHASRAITQYDRVINGLSEEECNALLEEAHRYNKSLSDLSLPLADFGQLSAEYQETLNVAGDGLIGYVTINCLGVELPIYHGTSEDVLNKACGHLEGSSLPVGGESTHAVLSAHRGLPSAKLFTDLDKIQIGDEFEITVLNQTAAYVVDQILIVEPTELEPLNIAYGEDYCTLMTCTPYGINTHRMFVRGHRIDTEKEELHIHADARQIPLYLVIPVIAIPVLVILLILSLILNRRRSKYYDNYEEITLRDFRKDREAVKQREEAKTKKHRKETK